jgi:hypothetical protein
MHLLKKKKKNNNNKKYTKIKCAAATRAFHLIYRLSNISKGLSF